MLERRGDAIRFHPTFAGIGRPTTASSRVPSRPREATRRVGWNGSSASCATASSAPGDSTTSTTSMTKPTTGVRPAPPQRPCPEDRPRTVADVFAEERAHLLALPDNPFPSDERVEVAVAKTPYVRFDANDYSVPHRYVGRTLVVSATLGTVRILDADRRCSPPHPRSFDRGQQVEDPAHIKALERDKRLARTHRAPPTASTMPRRRPRPCSPPAAKRHHHHLGVLARGLIELLDAYGPAALERAIAAALDASAAHLAGVRHIIDQHRRQSDTPPPLPLALPVRPPRPRRLRPASTTNPTPAMSRHTETTTMSKTPATEPDSVRQRLRDVGLYGLAVQDDSLLKEPWVERVIGIEDRERKRRSLERRLTNARIGPFKPIADFDWAWPERIDRPLIEELFSLAFGPRRHQHHPRRTQRRRQDHAGEEPPPPRRAQRLHRPIHQWPRTGSTNSPPKTPDASLSRRLRRFTRPSASRHRRSPIPQLRQPLRRPPLRRSSPAGYLTVPVLVTTNKPFSEWADVFLLRRLRRHPRRPPHPSFRNRPA